jgi:hypothetical protein
MHAESMHAETKWPQVDSCSWWGLPSSKPASTCWRRPGTFSGLRPNPRPKGMRRRGPSRGSPSHRVSMTERGLVAGARIAADRARQSSKRTGDVGQHGRGTSVVTATYRSQIMTLSRLMLYPFVAGGIALVAVAERLTRRRYSDRYLGCPLYREYAASERESACHQPSSGRARRARAPHDPWSR